MSRVESLEALVLKRHNEIEIMKNRLEALENIALMKKVMIKLENLLRM